MLKGAEQLDLLHVESKSFFNAPFDTNTMILSVGIVKLFLQERLDAGTIISWKKGEKSLHPTAKGRLVVFEHGKFQQKTGTPPAPEDAPQPRPVRQDSKGKGKGKGDQGKSEGKNQEVTVFPKILW